MLFPGTQGADRGPAPPPIPPSSLSLTPSSAVLPLLLWLLNLTVGGFTEKTNFTTKKKTGMVFLQRHKLNWLNQALKSGHAMREESGLPDVNSGR